MIKLNKASSRFQSLITMLIVACSYFILTRLTLFIASLPFVDQNISHFLELNFIGLIYDFAFLAYASIIFIVYLAVLPNRWWLSRFNRVISHTVSFLILYGMGFVAVAEWFFWDEFSVRFNFISVDYLVYRREVTDNIAESYPIVSLLLLLLFITSIIYAVWVRPRLNHALGSTELFSKRCFIGTSLLLSLIHI